jgi:hypothetical protein
MVNREEAQCEWPNLARPPVIIIVRYDFEGLRHGIARHEPISPEKQERYFHQRASSCRKEDRDIIANKSAEPIVIPVGVGDNERGYRRAVRLPAVQARHPGQDAGLNQLANSLVLPMAPLELLAGKAARIGEGHAEVQEYAYPILFKLNAGAADLV